MPSDDLLLSRDETIRLCKNLAHTRGAAGFTAEEANLLISEANGAFGMWLAYRAALDGQVLLDVRDGEVIFRSKPNGDRNLVRPDNPRNCPHYRGRSA